ncbi:MAG TPA: hypothetical protein PKE55_08585 [Kiritimatiellia bacterium]|nr:hypothetical protein [Kiritimatiellia bacterium]
MIKQRLQSLLKRNIIDRIIRDLRFGPEITLHQLSLRNQFRQQPHQAFTDIGFSVFSEFDEDGILLYLFSVIGPTSRLCLEIGCGDCRENNTTNLIVHHGWNGLLIDINQTDIDRAGAMFRAARPTKLHPPALLCQRVDEHNVNRLLASTGLPMDTVDLLSLDIDSTDLWVLKALEIQPRVIVVEINARWPEGVSRTVARDATDAPQSHPDYGMIYGGASLSAFCRVLCGKGYRLIGGNRMGTNAFFMRNDVGADLFPAVPESQVLGCPRARAIQKQCAEALAKYPWVAYEES